MGREEEELKVTAGSGTRAQGETQADSSGQSAGGCCGESGGWRGGMEEGVDQVGTAARSSLGPEAGPEDWGSGMPWSTANFIQKAVGSQEGSDQRSDESRF